MCLKAKGYKVESLFHLMCDLCVMLFKKKVYHKIHFGSRIFKKKKVKL